MKPQNSDDVLRAIEQAKRTAGWNNRRGDVQRFELASVCGHEPCTLLVVPARRWAYWQWERRTVERKHRHLGSSA